ncbi:hypothetical protein EB796_024615 [Bugula neritina]|uniref:Sushi domain-containing protein n=1 Tax=Bugula neritina TaxID=10212 RepID=A0A7J7IUJ4_BUGNE|nr:hypothetical protein EB796_024615 [Bugula neritina]
MKIVVEKLSSRKKRSITVDSIDNVTVYITASFPVTNYSSSLSVGDNQIYGGYWNRPLDNQYSYHIAVGFKAKTEDDVLKLTTIPGAESVRCEFESAMVQPITCSAPHSVANIETPVIEKNWNLDSAVSYNCKEGFTRRGPAIITCELVAGKGEWSDNPPICELPTQGMYQPSL